MYKTNKKIRFFFAKLAIFLIAFDSSPLFLGGSIYRPISIFPLLIYFVLLCFERLRSMKINKKGFQLFVVFALLLIFSFIKGLIYNDYDGFVDFFFTGAIGFASFISFSDFFAELKKRRIDVFEYVGRKYLKAMIIPCVFGFLQVITGLLFHISNSIINKLYSLVTYRFDISRVFLVCGEPAWAVVYLIVLFYFLQTLKAVKNRMLYSFCVLMLILSTFSMLGFMTIIIAFIIYYILYFLKRPSKIPIFGFLLCFVPIFLIIIDRIMLDFPINAYLTNRYEQIKVLIGYLSKPDRFYEFIQVTDDSLFVRFVNPVIGLIMSLIYPLFGVGGGYYYKIYPQIIEQYFPLSKNLREVNLALYANYHITCRNFFLRCFAEFGIFFGTGVFLRFLYKVKRIKPKDKKKLWLLVLVFSVVFNFDSFAYVLFIFILCLFNAINSNSRIDKRNDVSKNKQLYISR